MINRSASSTNNVERFEREESLQSEADEMADKRANGHRRLSGRIHYAVNCRHCGATLQNGTQICGVCGRKEANE